MQGIDLDRTCRRPAGRVGRGRRVAGYKRSDKSGRRGDRRALLEGAVSEWRRLSKAITAEQGAEVCMHRVSVLDPQSWAAVGLRDGACEDVVAVLCALVQEIALVECSRSLPQTAVLISTLSSYNVLYDNG